MSIGHPTLSRTGGGDQVRIAFDQRDLNLGVNGTAGWNRTLQATGQVLDQRRITLWMYTSQPIRSNLRIRGYQKSIPAGSMGQWSLFLILTSAVLLGNSIRNVYHKKKRTPGGDARPGCPPGIACAIRRSASYRIIYNWDGAPHDYSEFPQTLDQFLDKGYAPMKDTQVDAHFWCIGEHEAKWRGSQLEMVGDTENRVYDSARSMRHIDARCSIAVRIPTRHWSNAAVN